MKFGILLGLVRENTFWNSWPISEPTIFLLRLWFQTKKETRAKSEQQIASITASQSLIFDFYYDHDFNYQTGIKISVYFLWLIRNVTSELRNFSFGSIGALNLFSWILILKMDVKMNLRIITKNLAANSKIGSPFKIDFRADWTHESNPTAWELNYLLYDRC